MGKEEVIEAIKSLSVVELSEVVKALEEEFGVSAAAPSSRRRCAGSGSAFRRRRR